MSIAAGIDGIQHPELLDGREMPDDHGGDDHAARPHLLDAREHHHRPGVEAAPQGEGRSREEARRRREGLAARRAREKTTAERRKEAADAGADLEARRANAQKLIRAGARITPGTDSYWAAAPELIAHAEAEGAGSRHRHDHGDRRARRARHDAVAGDRRRRRATARSRRAVSRISARSKPASSPTS